MSTNNQIKRHLIGSLIACNEDGEPIENTIQSPENSIITTAPFEYTSGNYVFFGEWSYGCGSKFNGDDFTVFKGTIRVRDAQSGQWIAISSAFVGCGEGHWFNRPPQGEPYTQMVAHGGLYWDADKVIGPHQAAKVYIYFDFNLANGIFVSFFMRSLPYA